MRNEIGALFCECLPFLRCGLSGIRWKISKRAAQLHSARGVAVQAVDRIRLCEMRSELCFANAYLSSGAASPAYGGRYLNELLNFIPRVVWPSKPLIGFDYAK